MFKSFADNANNGPLFAILQRKYFVPVFEMRIF